MDTSLSSQSQSLFLPEMNGRKHQGTGDGTFYFVQVQARTLGFCSVSKRTSNGDRAMLDECLLDSGNWVKKQATTTFLSVADFRDELS